MSKIILFSVLLIFSFSVFAQQTVNQTDPQGRKQGFWQKRDAAGKLIYEGTFKDDHPAGEMKRYHPNGTVKAVLLFSENSDTVSARLFDQKGKLVAKGFYLGQKKTGEWSNYTEERLVSTENYLEDRKNGIAKRYYPSGELLDETTWVNDVQEGIYKAYDKAGNKYIECIYKNGKRNGPFVSFYPNEVIEMEASYVDNLRNGDWKYYNEDGKLNYKLKYDKGVLMTPDVLDSIQKINFYDLENNKNKVIDPEQFIADPAQYILKDRMNK